MPTKALTDGNRKQVVRDLTKAIFDANVIDGQFYNNEVRPIFREGELLRNPQDSSFMIDLSTMDANDHKQFNATYNGMTPLEAYIHRDPDFAATSPNFPILNKLQKACGDNGFYRTEDVDTYLKVSKDSKEAQKEYLIRALQPKIDHPGADKVTAHILQKLKTDFKMTPDAIKEQVAKNNIDGPSFGERLAKFGKHVQQAIFVGNPVKNMQSAFSSLFGGNKTKAVVKSLDAAGLNNPIPVVQAPSKPVITTQTSPKEKVIPEAQQRMEAQTGQKLLNKTQRLELFKIAESHFKNPELMKAISESESGYDLIGKNKEMIHLSSQEIKDFKEALDLLADLQVHLDVSKKPSSMNRLEPFANESTQGKEIQAVLDMHRGELIAIIEAGAPLKGVVHQIRSELDNIHNGLVTGASTDSQDRKFAIDTQRAALNISPQTGVELKAKQDRIDAQAERAPPPRQNASTREGQKTIAQRVAERQAKADQWLKDLRAQSPQSPPMTPQPPITVQAAQPLPVAPSKPVEPVLPVRPATPSVVVTPVPRVATTPGTIEPMFGDKRPASWPKAPGPAPEPAWKTQTPVAASPTRNPPLPSTSAVIMPTVVQPVAPPQPITAAGDEFADTRKNFKSAFESAFLPVGQQVRQFDRGINYNFSGDSPVVTMLLRSNNKEDLDAMVKALQEMGLKPQVINGQGTATIKMNITDIQQKIASNPGFAQQLANNFESGLPSVPSTPQSRRNLHFAAPTNIPIVQDNGLKLTPQQVMQDKTNINVLLNAISDKGSVSGVKADSARTRGSPEVEITIKSSNKVVLLAKVAALMEMGLVKREDVVAKGGEIKVRIKVDDINQKISSDPNQVQQFNQALLSTFQNKLDLTKMAIHMISTHDQGNSSPFLEKILTGLKKIDELKNQDGTPSSRGDKEHKLEMLIAAAISSDQPGALDARPLLEGIRSEVRAQLQNRISAVSAVIESPERKSTPKSS